METLETTLDHLKQRLTETPGPSTTRVITPTPGKPRVTASEAWRAKWLGLDEHTAEVRAMAEAFERLAKRFAVNDRTSPLLFVSSKSGTGKTHCAKRVWHFARAVAVAAWTLGHWRLAPPSVCFIRWAEFVESGSDGAERDARESDLTILDDVGSESDVFKSGAPVDKLSQLLSAREGRFTVVTSNLSLSDWSKRDARVADRLLRKSERVQIVGTKSWALVGQETAHLPYMDVV